MKRFVRRISFVAASAVIAGGAVLGAGGVASAATSEPVGHATCHHNYGRGWHPIDGRGDPSRVRHREEGHRWDGHRLYRWDDGRWIDVTPYHNGRIDHWYLDQLLLAER